MVAKAQALGKAGGAELTAKIRCLVAELLEEEQAWLQKREAV